MDLLEQLEEITRPPYDGPAPLHFTADYFTPEELMAAYSELHHRREYGRALRTWHLGVNTGWCGLARDHRLCLLTCDHRCHPAHRERGCSCVGDFMEQANCPACRWHFIGTESDAVEAWHDHAWPGWRDLPIVPLTERGRGGGMNDKIAFDCGTCVIAAQRSAARIARNNELTKHIDTWRNAA